MEASRHLKAIFSTVAPDFICATAEGFGIGVAVTYRELIIAKARMFRSPLLRRYRLRDLGAIRERRGYSMSFLLIDVGEQTPTTEMILYQTAFASDFERMVSTIRRLSRLRRGAGAGPGRMRRRRLPLARSADERQRRTSVMA